MGQSRDTRAYPIYVACTFGIGAVSPQLEEDPNVFVVHMKATLGHTPYPTGHDARIDCIWVLSVAHWLLLHEPLGKARIQQRRHLPFIFGVSVKV